MDWEGRGGGGVKKERREKGWEQRERAGDEQGWRLNTVRQTLSVRDIRRGQSLRWQGF